MLKANRGLSESERRSRLEVIRSRRRLLVVALVSALLVVPSAEAGRTSDGERWYRAVVERGETHGYSWWTGVKGLKHEPLKEICALASMAEPPRDDDPFIEREDAAECGSLRRATESVVVTLSAESGTERVLVLEALYRPTVRKVVFALDTGERRIYRPLLSQIPRLGRRGIPRFRYISTSFEGEICIRRVSTYDGEGSIVAKEARPPCD